MTRPDARVRGGARLRVAVAGLALALGCATGCKRSVAPKVDEVWDETPAVGQAEALASLAPPWGAPIHATLDNGLAVVWLHEPDAVVTHVRLLLPTADAEGPYPAAERAIVHTHLRRALTQKTKGRGVTVQGRTSTDRIEVALHFASEDMASVLASLAAVVSNRDPGKSFEAARADVVGRLPRGAATEARAIAALAAQLLGQPATDQFVDHARATGAERDALLRTWTNLVDPQRAVIVVHAAEPAEAHRERLQALADRWAAPGRRPMPPRIVDRLRPTDTAPAGPGRLLAEPATPLGVVDGPTGKPVLWLGRTVPTPTPLDRALARLGQRVMQEELDVRLVSRGDHAVFVMRVPLAGDVDERATEAVDALSSLADERQPQQRLFTAAQLWLGARVVQSSLDGEDWTALWSDAADLATDDAAIAGALAQDAGLMLDIDAQTLVDWQRKWFDPRRGEPGWHWVVAGTSDRDLRRLSRIVPLAQ